jgi:hypothetical protein
MFGYIWNEIGNGPVAERISIQLFFDKKMVCFADIWKRREKFKIWTIELQKISLYICKIADLGSKLVL